MNIHAPSKDIQDFFKCLEFKGKRFIKKNKTFIRAKHKILNVSMLYCFEDNFAWFSDNS